MKKTGIIFTICLLLGALSVHANNITVTNVTLYNLNSGQNYIHVQFDVSWENSWRNSNPEWDAAWVFVKYRPEGSNDWQHCLLSTNDAHHTKPSGALIETGVTGTNGVGVFVYRDSNGTGDVDFVEAQLRWQLGGTGIQEGDNVELSVSAIEMVYIPPGDFYVGDGTSSDIQGQFESGQSGNAFLITNESYAITLGGGANTWRLGNNDATGMNTADDFSSSGASQTLLSTFPKGHAAFYCMKYEISQGQYAEFLSKLTDAQDDARYYVSVANRYTIGGSYSNYVAGAPDRACNYLSWMDGAAYADWAGLRPITELEYEKTCRGPQSAVDTEYAWGSASIHAGAYSLSNDGLPYSKISNPGIGTGNASYATTDGSINGPLRCGIFAASSTTNPTRAEAGASYYGVMELSGNLWERPVTVGNATGRGFIGTHGDGVLTSDGYGNNSDWPGYVTSKISGAIGAGFRGGVWYNSTLSLRVSDRFYAAFTGTVRSSTFGWRAARSAP